MRVLHSSDLHGGYPALQGVEADFDVWLDTGDFFPNLAGPAGPVDADEEVAFQRRWMAGAPDLAGRIAIWLAGRPALIMPGNHDYVDLAGAVRDAGARAIEVVPRGVELLGLRWAGFRQVKWMDGTWNGETADFSEVVSQTFLNEPDVLVTHGPPAGLLESELGYGISALRDALQQSTRIRTHFFGHDHRTGGMSTEAFGIRFYNGAKSVRMVEIQG